MTTIAIRDGLIATDTRGVANGWIEPAEFKKIHVHPETGAVYAVTGGYAQTMTAVRNLLNGKPADCGEHCRVVEIRPGGTGRNPPRLFVHEDDGWYELAPIPEFMAWGSGMPAATAAMYAGANAVQAIEIAAKLDNDTGPEVDCYRFAPAAARRAA